MKKRIWINKETGKPFQEKGENQKVFLTYKKWCETEKINNLFNVLNRLRTGMSEGKIASKMGRLFNTSSLTSIIASQLKIVIGSVLFSIVVANYSCADQTPYLQGQILYENFCANCHMEDGTGLMNVIPPLKGSDYLMLSSRKLPCIIRKGIKEEIIVNVTKFNTEMPGVPQLTEFEITNVINYINTSWGNDFKTAKHLDVREALKECE